MTIHRRWVELFALTVLTLRHLTCILKEGLEVAMRGFLNRLFGGGTGTSANEAVHFTIKCQHCGAFVKIRVDKSNDLVADYDSVDGGYTLSKDVQDSECFRIMKLSARFSPDKSLLSSEVVGGEIVETS
jgi:hypothetical protein